MNLAAATGDHVRWEAVHSSIQSGLWLNERALNQAFQGRVLIGFAVTNRRLNHYEKRVAALLARETARQLKSLLRRRLSQHTPLLADDFSECLTELASMCGESSRSMANSRVGQMIASSVRGAIIAQLNNPKALPNEVAARVCESLNSRASLLDAEFRLPPVRNDEKPQPVSPVQARARKAEAGMRSWKRKMSLARTKLAAYRKKVNYYKKKGHL
jgi:hypothetical protein